MKTNYQIIVIGGGHAGCEAAYIAAKMDCSTLLISLELNKLAAMPCNPAIGGPGKGHLVREIDALGGLMAKITDKTLIQIRCLNTSKGPAVQAYRAQIEKKDYMAKMLKVLKKTKNLDLLEDEVIEINILDNKNKKIITKSGKIISGQALIITTGTFLNGQLMIGQRTWSGGRIDAPSTSGLSSSLKKLGLKLGRLMTDTPPRVDSRSINYRKTIIQPGTPGPCSFSLPEKEVINFKNQIPCYLTYTTPQTHQIIKENINLSPVYLNLKKQTFTPRHCPSLDEKVINFPNRLRHPIFIEPEGRKTNWIYLQGAYIAMPENIQEKIIHSIPGLENAKILQYGYAISYDFVHPYQIKNNLETKKIPGLFLAGQINGTSGYEEAAAQGIIAGINAALWVRDIKLFILKRNEAYIGVLIDDLVTKIHREPYRILTARAEYRLSLRQSNADLRLGKYAFELGLISKQHYQQILKKEELIKKIINKLKNNYFKLNNKPISYFQFLSQPNSCLDKIKKTVKIPQLSPDTEKEIKAQALYEGYLKKQEKEILRMKKLENKKIPLGIDYQKIPGLSNAASQRLKEVSPQTLGQALRIEGVTPADFSILSLWVHRFKRIQKND